MENQKHIEAYQDLFDYLHDEHDLILLQSEMDEIIELSANAVRKYNEASEGSKQQDTEANDNKHAVNQQSELLLAFAEYIKTKTFTSLIGEPQHYVDRFLKANNCG